MPARSVRIRLIDIREEIAGIRSLTKNATAESFSTDWAMKRAVHAAQSTTIRPGTRSNSRVLAVTRVVPARRAWAAISTS
ncbi:MAG: hypothetical protein QOJ84_4256 [Bradyrhizobium sp.]|nr:hypothetical protein [Bradyrhizobium sp.]